MERINLNTKNLGKNISAIRKLRDISEEVLSIELGISIDSVRRIESGDELVNEESLEQIANALGVTPKYILEYNKDTLVFNNNIHDQNNTVINQNFNSTEKIVELYDELLKVERQKVAQLEYELKELRTALENPK